MTVLEHMSTKTEPKDLSLIQLSDLCQDEYINADYKKRCQNEMVIRYITCSSIEEGKRQLKVFMAAWGEDDMNKEDAAVLLEIVNTSIDRCGGQRKGLLVSLGAAKKILEKAL